MKVLTFSPSQHPMLTPPPSAHTLLQDTGGRGSVKQVYVKGSSDASFGPMVNKWGAMWELGNAPQPPLDFKIELDNGDAVSRAGRGLARLRL